MYAIIDHLYFLVVLLQELHITYDMLNISYKIGQFDQEKLVVGRINYVQDS